MKDNSWFFPLVQAISLAKNIACVLITDVERHDMWNTNQWQPQSVFRVVFWGVLFATKCGNICQCRTQKKHWIIGFLQGYFFLRVSNFEAEPPAGTNFFWIRVTSCDFISNSVLKRGFYTRKCVEGILQRYTSTKVEGSCVAVGRNGCGDSFLYVLQAPWRILLLVFPYKNTYTCMNRWTNRYKKSYKHR